ncbi:MFS transporter [Streptomyces liangshanensis]|uniref:MFS transporter n=1 Tax=Streptomyces liangshanensis TaxID=2717324 RepID=A0A6G9GUF8_9ACTN|nr:MFS transporter [Streptomyces liangshanensis]QIQ01903.1 MFS transporter [Streptomyces liangshanensis]
MTVPSVAPSRHRHPGVLLAVLSTATFMTTLDVFIVNVGLRPIGAALHESSLANLSWILNAYAIVFAALLVPAGRLADRYGVKGTFLSGLAVFGLGSVGAALCGDVWLLVALRCVQAVGAAAIVPTSLALILNGMPKERIPRSIQIWAISGSLGASAGPTLGGLLVEASWRWIFIVNAPIALGALLIAVRTAPDPRHNTETRIPDLLGGALLITGIGALTLALVQGPTWGWGSGRTLGALVAAVLALGATVLRSARASAPVIDLTLFRNRTFTWANVGVFLLSLAFGLQLLGLVFWMQEGWGWSAIRTGLAISPGPVMVSVTSLGLRRYTAKLPAGLVAAAGGVLLGLGAVLIGSSLGASPDYYEVLPGWILCGAGTGLWTPTLIGAASSGLAPHQTSTGSAVVQMNRQIGLTLGVALLVVVVGSSQIDLAALPQFLHAWWWSAALSLLGALTCLFLLRSGSAGPARTTAPAAKPPVPAER